MHNMNTFTRILDDLYLLRGFRYPMELSVKVGSYETMALIAGDGTGSQFTSGQANGETVSALKVSIIDVANNRARFELTPEEIVNA